MNVWSTLQGHLWTVAPHVAGSRRPPRTDGAALSVAVDDPVVGRVVLGARLFDRHGADTVLVVVHGLGGSSGSAYVGRALDAAEAAAAAALAVDLRGADGRGEDLYHAGLTSDLRAVVASPELRRYRNVHLLGYSLGGHLALASATEALDTRVRSAAAVCSPLDLDASATAFDRTRCWPYRRHVLAALKASHAAVARRRGSRIPGQRVARIRTIRDWDATVVAPRFGFAGVGDYYARASVGPRLGELRIPSLYVAATADPMVPFETVSALLRPEYPKLEVRRLSAGGHVGFPPSCDLGVSARLGLESQIVHWLLRHA